jgi:hypothetical protein
VRRFGPDAALEIEVFFARTENLAEASAGQQLEANSIRRPVVRMLVEQRA